MGGLETATDESLSRTGSWVGSGSRLEGPGQRVTWGVEPWVPESPSVPWELLAPRLEGTLRRHGTGTRRKECLPASGPLHCRGLCLGGSAHNGPAFLTPSFPSGLCSQVTPTQGPSQATLSNLTPPVLSWCPSLSALTRLHFSTQSSSPHDPLVLVHRRSPPVGTSRVRALPLPRGDQCLPLSAAGTVPSALEALVSKERSSWGPAWHI